MERYPPISIIIPIKNRKNMIPRLIKSLLNLDYPKYEIIIIDDASTDGSSKLLDKYPLTHIRLAHSIGSANARNVGIQNASHPTIALTDSDCVLSQSWLKELCPYLADFDLIGGYVQFRDYAEHRMAPHTYIPSESEMQLNSNVNFINTSNLLFKKAVWQSLGGFRSYRLEDIDFSWRALKMGYRLWYVPKGIVYHDNPTHFIQKFKRWRDYGKSYTDLIYIHNLKLRVLRPSKEQFSDTMRPSMLLLSSIVLSWVYAILLWISPIAMIIGIVLGLSIQIRKFLAYKRYPGWKFIFMMSIMKIAIVSYSILNALRKKPSKNYDSDN